MSILRILTPLLLTATALIIIRCSSPVANGGGTETGNPEVVACAEAAFAAMNTEDRWCVATYVPGGEIRLNPASLSYDPPGYTIAKRTASPSDTTDSVAVYVVDTIYIVDTLPVSDTILRPETTYVRDTITRTGTTCDTTVSVTPAGTATIIRTGIKTDSVFITDTLISIDTLITPDTLLVRDTVLRTDTIFVPKGAIPWTGDTTGGSYYTDTTRVTLQPVVQYYRAPVLTGTEYPAGDSAPRYTYLTGAPAATSMAVPAPNYRIDTTTALGAITKEYAATSGVLVRETYADLDGNGLLYTAASKGTPWSRYAVVYNAAGSIQNTVLDFDAGPDGSFASVANNRIFALQRETTTPDSTQSVRYYGAATTGMLRDSMFLSIHTRFTPGDVESLTTVYTVTTGSDTTRTDDRLAAIAVTKTFSSGGIARIEMIIIPESLRHGTVTLTLFMTDGSKGIMTDGIIDLNTGVFSGTYRRNDTEIKFVLSYP